MENIKTYLNDGANWQAQAVLAYLRAHDTNAINSTWSSTFQEYMTKLNVGRYENCREQGYIFSVTNKKNQRNYAVYEHRNSDALCVVVFDKITINTPTLTDVCDAMGNSKYNYTKDFKCGEIVECGDYILEDMKEFIESDPITLPEDKK